MYIIMIMNEEGFLAIWNEETESYCIMNCRSTCSVLCLLKDKKLVLFLVLYCVLFGMIMLLYSWVSCLLKVYKKKQVLFEDECCPCGGHYYTSKTT